MTLEVDEHQPPKLLNAPGSGQPIHLAYLDGVRGLAALYVLLEHIQLSGLDLINARALAPGTGTHLLLVHNANPAWLFSINPPMWSIAVEWQIYFIFALLLLPVWRAAGNGAALLVAFVLGLSPIYLLPSSFNIEWSCPWYIGLFAMGLVAANVGLTRV